MGEVMFRSNVVMKKATSKSKAAIRKPGRRLVSFGRPSLQAKGRICAAQGPVERHHLTLPRREHFVDPGRGPPPHRHPERPTRRSGGAATTTKKKNAVRFRQGQAGPQRGRRRAYRMVPGAACALQVPAPCGVRRKSPRPRPGKCRNSRSGRALSLLEAEKAPTNAIRRLAAPPPRGAFPPVAAARPAVSWPRRRRRPKQVRGVRKTLKEARAIGGDPPPPASASRLEVTITALAAIRRQIGPPRDLDVMALHVERPPRRARSSEPRWRQLRTRNGGAALRLAAASPPARRAQRSSAIVRRLAGWDFFAVGTEKIATRSLAHISESQRRGAPPPPPPPPPALFVSRPRRRSALPACAPLLRLAVALNAQAILERCRGGRLQRSAVLEKFASLTSPVYRRRPAGRIWRPHRVEAEKAGAAIVVGFERLFAETRSAFANRISACPGSAERAGGRAGISRLRLLRRRRGWRSANCPSPRRWRTNNVLSQVDIGWKHPQALEEGGRFPDPLGTLIQPRSRSKHAGRVSIASLDRREQGTMQMKQNRFWPLAALACLIQARCPIRRHSAGRKSYGGICGWCHETARQQRHTKIP